MQFVRVLQQVIEFPLIEFPKVVSQTRFPQLMGDEQPAGALTFQIRLVFGPNSTGRPFASRTPAPVGPRNRLHSSLAPSNGPGTHKAMHTGKYQTIRSLLRPHYRTSISLASLTSETPCGKRVQPHVSPSGHSNWLNIHFPSLVFLTGPRLHSPVTELLLPFCFCADV